MNIKEIAAVHWSKSEAGAALAGLVQDWLAGKPEGFTCGTVELLRGLGADMEDAKALQSHLSSARTWGKLDGYFSRGEVGAFKKQRIVWHPLVYDRLMTNDEKIAWIKEHDPESYARIVAQ